MIVVRKAEREDSISSVLHIAIEDHWAGKYRIEYDGKYITLYGGDKNYKVNSYFQDTLEDGNSKIEYEEMVLIPVVCEGRGLDPKISKVNEESIEISLV